MKRVLYIAQDDESAQFRYRIRNIQEALRQSRNWELECIFTSEVNKEKLDDVALLVIERQAAKDDALLKIIETVKSRGIKVLFDLDDLVFDYRDLPLLMWSTKSRNAFYWVGYFWGVRRIAKKADGFICTNDFLGKKLKRSFGKPYRVIRNSLNGGQIKISDEAMKKKRGERRQGFWIGYFSGSPTHARDFEMIESEIGRFLERYEDARVRLVGYMRLSKGMQHLVDEDRVEVLPVVEPLKLQRLMAEVDVNIAPLVVNDFTNCKSELKFFEAAVVETTTIASPIYTFEKAIKDGENGYLAKPGEWLEKLEYLYEHPEESKKVARAARKYALQYYYGAEFLKEVEGVYDYFAS